MKWMGAYRQLQSADLVQSHSIRSTLLNPIEFTCTPREEVVFSVRVYHAVLQDTFPFAFNPRNLVVGAKYYVSIGSSTILKILVFRVRVVQIAVDSFGISWGG